MSEAKHTPGPWTVCDPVPEFDCRRIFAGNQYIACVGDSDHLTNQEADANLIASAPDLLEALEDCCVIAKPENPACCCPVYRMGKHGGCAENEDGECHIWKAIQKAKGIQQ